MAIFYRPDTLQTLARHFETLAQVSRDAARSAQSRGLLPVAAWHAGDATAYADAARTVRHAMLMRCEWLDSR